MSTKVLIIIEISGVKWLKQKLETEYNPFESSLKVDYINACNALDVLYCLLYFIIDVHCRNYASSTYCISSKTRYRRNIYISKNLMLTFAQHSCCMYNYVANRGLYTLSSLIFRLHCPKWSLQSYKFRININLFLIHF